MKTEIVPFEKHHAVEIMERNKAEGLGQASSVSVDEMVEKYLTPGSAARTFLIDGMVVLCGGIINLKWKRGEVWVLHSSLFQKYRKIALDMMKQIIPEIAISCKFRRVQATAFDGYGDVFRQLGFKREGRLRAYGPEGQDVTMFSQIFKEVF
jgi:hypothetical protein